MALIVRHIDDVPWQEGRRVRYGDRTSSVWNKIMDYTDDRTVAYTRYDPGMMLARHSHHADEVIFIVEGEVTVGDQSWPAGTIAILEKGTYFGPLVAGPQGAILFEMFAGISQRDGQDRTGFDELLAERGALDGPHPTFDMPPLRQRG